MKRFLIASVLLMIWTNSNAAEAPEELVMIYTSYGVRETEGWRIPLRFWVHEDPDAARRLIARSVRGELRRRAGLSQLDDEQIAIYRQRTHGFIADSESRERVVFQFEGDPSATPYRLEQDGRALRTDRNGLVEGEILLPHAAADAILENTGSSNGWLTLRVVSSDHGGSGRVRLIEPEGLSIISDIDDTVKVTNIPLGEVEVLNNTFFRPFRAAPCMAETYRAWPTDTAFHYVSGGPWQMYAPLASFLFDSEIGFPEGSFHMKNVRTNPFETESYQDIWRLVAAGSEEVTFEQKVGQIGTLLNDFPQREFILIGDSGERDPEVFATIRSRYPDRVAEIRIRDVVNDAESNPGRLAGMTVIPALSEATSRCIVRDD